MEKDQYGGWKQIKGEATGYFHVEELEGRWWFITPEGYGFIAVGMNHDNIRIGDHNRDYWNRIDRPKGFDYEFMIKHVQYLNMTAKGYGIKATGSRLTAIAFLMWKVCGCPFHMPTVITARFRMCSPRSLSRCACRRRRKFAANSGMILT